MSTTRYIVDNQSEQTINNEPILRPYKVYTALLTQSGGDNDTGVTGGDLTIGVTYKINVDDIDADFTNVGAPNNNLDTYFVATGTTPNSWGTNGSLRFNTGAPVVTVLENTIGNIMLILMNYLLIIKHLCLVGIMMGIWWFMLITYLVIILVLAYIFKLVILLLQTVI